MKEKRCRMANRIGQAISTGAYFIKYHEKNPLPVLEISTPRTDVFRKVYSSVGSFTNLRGGNVYPSTFWRLNCPDIRRLRGAGYQNAG